MDRQERRNAEKEYLKWASKEKANAACAKQFALENPYYEKLAELYDWHANVPSLRTSDFSLKSKLISLNLCISPVTREILPLKPVPKTIKVSQFKHLLYALHKIPMESKCYLEEAEVQ